uniref:Alpha-endosulfine n=1 Tax=Clastoptera arizonana TaxID=38151 RepID=A0A1B6DJ79_9HEMI
MSNSVEGTAVNENQSENKSDDHVFAVPNKEMTNNEVEKIEEAKLKAKYPTAHNFPLSGHSAFLQKKLAKGQKYFDSGDYQMAKQTTGLSKSRQLPQTVLGFGTGEAIPTPESVPARKTSIIQPKFSPSST